MPPKTSSKPGGGAPSKKTEQKKKEKVIEDKTFGLKNKKGSKQQKFIQQVQKQVQSGGNPSAAKRLEQAKLDSKKKVDGEELDFNAIFKPVAAAQKVEKGVDPKSVLCAFFKQGNCTKGDKCKFSHDMTIERKTEKRSLYCDLRDDEAAADTMDNWDEAKLKEVVEKKHAEADKSKPKTDIICKFFLDAVEKSKYGWFWECPNGENCHYRHALPSGFVLKKDRKKEDKKDDISLEDLIERERAALGSVLTKVTLVSFIAWKKRKLREKKETLQKDEDKKRADFKAGRQVGLSGREMFTFNPDMAIDNDLEDGDATFDTRNLSDDEEEVDTNEYREINFDEMELEAEEEDGSGTQATIDRIAQIKLDSASGSNGEVVPIDENLFAESDIDDSDDESEDEKSID